MKGAFCISLDFELHWGGFEKWPLDLKGDNAVKNSYNKYFLCTREVIPRVLNLFSQYEMHVTWAAVGMLLHSTREELLSNAPTVRPTYKATELSAYNYIEQVGIGPDEASDPFHFGNSLVKEILNTPNQELGTHTFSHYYCNEAGQTVAQFKEDLMAAQRAAATHGRTLRSLVFPRNQFNDSYLKACYELGIRVVRSNPVDWFWHIESTQAESGWKRLHRGMDAYFPIGGKNTYRLEGIQTREGYPICLPASRLLRPYQRREFVLNDMKISRILGEMKSAANNSEVYHLWWHPHNFANYPEQSLSGLKKILDGFHKLRAASQMESLNMGELYDRRNPGNNP